MSKPPRFRKKNIGQNNADKTLKTGKPRKPQSQPRTPRSHKPDSMSLEEWQHALRREFGREQKFRWRGLGQESVSDNPSRRPSRKSARGSAGLSDSSFEYEVRNPKTGGVSQGISLDADMNGRGGSGEADRISNSGINGDGGQGKAGQSDSDVFGGIQPGNWLDVDERTGKTCLKLPLPPPAALDQLAQWLNALAGKK